MDSRINHELDLHTVAPEAFVLTRLTRVLERLGNPHKGRRYVHVAGTKGKGSTCAFTAEILRQAGYRVGLFTSPHLWHWRERIRVCLPQTSSVAAPGDLFTDGIPEADAAALLTEIRDAEAAEAGGLTYFETLTALAFCFFRQAGTDVAVLETGLGGRLDATNVVEARVSVITPVSLEHTRQLGSTLAAIAAEKAGIIKPPESATGPRPLVVVAPQSAPAREVIEARVRDTGGQRVILGEDIHYGGEASRPDGQAFWVETPRQRWDLFSRLVGRHQIINAAAAVSAVAYLAETGLPVDAKAVARGIAETVCPGRFEILTEAGRPVVLDAAHNPASAAQLAQTLHEVFPGQRLVLVLGISEGKDWEGIAAALIPGAAHVLLTRAAHPRAMRLTCAQIGPWLDGRRCQVADGSGAALAGMREQTRAGDVIVVTGSMFLVGEIRRKLVLEGGRS